MLQVMDNFIGMPKRLWKTDKKGIKILLFAIVMHILGLSEVATYVFVILLVDGVVTTSGLYE